MSREVSSASRRNRRLTEGETSARLDGHASPEQRIKRLPDNGEATAAREPQDAVATDRLGLLGRRIDASGRRLAEQ